MNVIKVSQSSLDAAFRQPVAALMSLRISLCMPSLFVRCS